MTPEPRHGTPAGYRDDGCRCEACRHAIAKNHNLYKLRRAANGGPLMRPKLGTYRRLRALMAIGWPRRELARLAGYSSDPFSHVLNGTREHVGPEVYERVCSLYERLCTTPGPSNSTRRRAASKGWPPPLAWDDIDDPDEKPAPRYRPVKKRPAAELLAEWAHLRGLGVSIEQAAVQLGVAVEAIERAGERSRTTAA